ncbi:MAG: hypothetical protein HKN51_11970 [Saprospiraceae bacterium]|nr:hypothetical protein [Saprospiraceae bacterium]
MKQLNNYFLLFTVIVLYSACTTSPIDIDYNEDQCHACKMIISDSRFGAELVTTKGKIYKFDAIECLVPELNKNGADNYKYIMVTDFENPKTLIDATKSTFMISESVPSPMGAYLSAFQSIESGKKALGSKKGNLLTWNDLCLHELFDFE